MTFGFLSVQASYFALSFWELLGFCSCFKKVGKDVNIFVQSQKVLNWILFLCFFLGNGITN